MMHPESFNTLPEAIATIGHFLWRAILMDGGRYALAALGMAGIVAALKRTSWASRVLQARKPSRADLQRELLTSFSSILIYGLMGALTVFITVSGWVPGGFRFGAPAWEVALFVAMMIVAHDAWFYWTHRAMHHPKLFKYFHRLHHRTITPTPFTAYAFAWPEAVVQALFVVLWEVFIPTPVGAFFWFMAIQIIRNVMGHAGLELHPAGWADHPLLGWVSTTTHHDMHHAGSFNHNYGFYFTFWDRLMGTEHPEYRARFRAVTASQPLPAHAQPAE